MKKYKWYVLGSLGLVILSIILYFLHYKIFGQLETTMYYTLLDICFIPLNILIVSLIFERLLTLRAKKERLNKINMLVGVFFSELGFKLMTYISKGNITSCNLVTCFDNLNEVETIIKNHDHTIDVQVIDIYKIENLLSLNRDLFINLLSNENILEHEIFTNLLMSIVHLRDELIFIQTSPKNKEDLSHIQIDIERVYKAITIQWVYYLKHLKKLYPYLYKNAIQLNPFEHTCNI